MTLSIIIKARNEAANIARALESALRIADRFGGEVILADSCSTDDTIAIATRYPVKIVQLEVPAEACCGMGPELGFQQARGDYVYLLDGDMEMVPEFVEKGIALLEGDKGLAGIGGYIREMRAKNQDFKRRNQRQAKLMQNGAIETESLSGGGLYRRAALASVGYMSDRNLHALEEYDLGTRLRQAGWRLIMLPDHAADHYSYDLGTWALLRHRLRGGNFLSHGELLRAAIASGYAGLAVSEVRAIRISLAVLAYWALAIMASALSGYFLLGLSVALGLAVVAATGLGLIRRDLFSGFYSMLIWHLGAGGLLLGFLKERRDPAALVRFRQIASESPRSEEAVRRSVP